MSLLQNPGFELDWEVDSSHRCLVYAPDGTLLDDRQIGNIFTPSKWVTWFVHDPGTWDQPEVRDAWVHHDHRRVRSGQKAILLFTFDRKHAAGFLQQVTVTPGTHLRLSAYGQAWSNHNDPRVSPHPNDPEWSEGAPLVGYNEVVLYEDDVPPLNGDPQNDAVGNVQFCVGVDPTGGMNPLADTVVWSDPAYSYNRHHRLPYVEAVAEGDTATVFLRSRTLWSFRHNDAYWDEVELVEVDEQPPGECRGHPRVQYDRTVMLLPPESTWLWPTALSSVLERYRASIVYSADDAGIGDLDVRRVVAVNPSLWPGGSQGLGEFFAEHYEGVGYHPVETDLENAAADVAEVLEGLDGEPQNRPPNVNAGPDQTVALADGAMLSGTVTDDGLPDPPGVVSIAWSQVYGSGTATFADDGAVDTAVSFSEVGIYSLRLTADDGELTAYDAVAVTVQDEEPPPEEPPWAGMEPITLHVQQPTAHDGYGDLEFARDVRPAGFKTVGHMQQLQRVKSVSPNTVTIYRQFVENQGQYWDVNPQEGAREFLRTFLDSLLQLQDHVDLVEGLNEIGVPDEIARLSEWYCWFAEALVEEGLPAKPLMLSIPVGNPKHPEESGLAHIEEMLPAVRKAVELGGAIGYHGYHRVYNGAVDPPWDSNWYHYAGRCLASWDPVFNQHGLYPNYVMSEAGAFLNALAGWKHGEVFRGDWAAYARSLLELRSEINAWNAAHNYRAICYTLFTYANPGVWRYYNLYGYARALAEALTGGPVGAPTLHTRIKRILSFFRL